DPVFQDERNSVSENLAERLIAAVGDERREAGLVFSAAFQPVGGPGGRLMPPTFPVDADNGEPNLLARRRVDGQERQSVVLDQVPSQANRVEEALGRARESGRVSLPVFALEAKGGGKAILLTSLDFPHRYADAYLRDSEIDGVRFDKTAQGAALRSASSRDVRPLFEREPYTLLFGAW